MTALNWVARPSNALVWDAEINGKKIATIIGGTQRFEGKKVLEFETYSCFVNEVSVGQKGTPAEAKQLCETIIDNMPLSPLRVDGELHLWMIVPHGVDRRAEGCIYGDPRFEDGRRITTENIVSLDWDADGDLIATTDHSYFRLCKQERTAELIALGITVERQRKPIDDGKAE